ncbi:MAG: transglutaminase domain-containing protein [Bacilli bacterium]|nr:transglutaminase domain-containing protein [Bacilli bacterium]
MKKLLTTILLLGILGLGFFYKDDIIKYAINEYTYRYANVTQTANAYHKTLDIAFVKETNDFFPKERQDLLNIFYSSLNNGVDKFTYYCTDPYKDCMKESEALAKDNTLLSNLNNFVHPYNSYKELTFRFSSFGKVEVTIEKQYTKEEIAELNTKVDALYQALITPAMTPTEQIRVIHDYIINHSTYDQEKADYIVGGTLTNKGTYSSETAYGVLLQGQGICSGFSDAMELFLTKMNIPSYKVASATHIWNLVYIDNKWYHLDLTWDNPIVNGSGKLLLHDFFLIDTATIQKIDTGHHQYDTNIYIEAK